MSDYPGENILGCVGGVLAILLYSAFCAFLGYLYGEGVGYCQALADVQNNVTPKYKLVKQADGETVWTLNKEQNK